jgi:hypothetical protein
LLSPSFLLRVELPGRSPVAASPLTSAPACTL